MSELKVPLIIINFKVYAEVEGPKALDLALKCQLAAEETGANIAIAPPMVELSMLCSKLRIPVLSQHVGGKRPGSITGFVSAESIKAAGAVGSLINHSEHRLTMAEVAQAVKRCRELGLRSIVCTESPETSAAVAHYAPDFIAVEPPELIGGDVSVTSARPEVVSDTVKMVKAVDPKVQVLCGAGVKNGNDVHKAIELGASGVLLASGVVRSKDVDSTLKDLIRGVQ